MRQASPAPARYREATDGDQKIRNRATLWPGRRDMTLDYPAPTGQERAHVASQLD
ncbi:hypothetical protein [Acetobacter fallax]|uniref:Uncharacterized protein n=1 Tax=Acetobacter fallax TaxID=1737473 RepID=A0ABX0KDD1_9PROT|nr:hypothetical protein [Acetobacter fallax]NHO33086.1 hypothetical protein [Acetobacter fallax]NHO36668.1 hypothetical protein [Acetobacter fallax]